MPFSAGVYSRIYSWVSDKNSAIPITASRMDGDSDGFATGLSTCLLKDGTQTVTANIPFSGFKLTGIGAGTLATDAAQLAQVQSSIYNWVVSGGTVDVITATYSPAVTALVDGMELDFRATGANTSTTPTFAPNGLTAHNITKLGGSALVAGDIAANLAEYQLRYNLANTRWELLNPNYIQPFVDTIPLIKGSSDATKLIRFEVDGNTTGTTRVITARDSNGTMAYTADVIPVTTGGTAATSFTNNSVIIANGTGSALTGVAPSTSGNVLTSNGTTWASTAAPSTIKAWVNFNGATVAIRASSNVTSITHNATGDFTVNFTTPLADANYVPSVVFSANYGVNGYAAIGLYANGSNAEVTPTTSAFRFRCWDGAGTQYDPKYVMVSVVGN